MVPVKEELIPANHPNRPNKKLESLKAIVFHYTANDNPNATDTMNAKYFARKFVKIGADYFESDSKTPFRYGSTQVLADTDSVTIAIPPEEAAWSAGDRNLLPYTVELKGQQKLAKTLFNNRQNYQILSIEICNNDVVKNSQADWDEAVINAAEWAISYIREKGLKVDFDNSFNPQKGLTSLSKGNILLLRHFDLTGKRCPAPFVDAPVAWWKFLTDFNSALIENVPFKEVYTRKEI